MSFLLGGFLTALLFSSPSASVEYDRGKRRAAREFQSAEACRETACVITAHGAIRLDPTLRDRYWIELGLTHRGVYRSIAIFQQSTTLEQGVSERILNRVHNRPIVDLEALLERGKTDTIFIYGVQLHHTLDEGDLLVLRLTPKSGDGERRAYFFRFHRDEIVFDFDFAVVQPINFFLNNPGDRIRAARTTAAVAFSLTRNLDPERKYSLFHKLGSVVRFNLFLGLLVRQEVIDFHGDKITTDRIDGFAGAGLTIFKFLSAGYAVNLVRSPHSGFPFVALELRSFGEFLVSLKTDTNTRWHRYLEEERSRSLGDSRPVVE